MELERETECSTTLSIFTAEEDVEQEIDRWNTPHESLSQEIERQ